MNIMLLYDDNITVVLPVLPTLYTLRTQHTLSAVACCVSYRPTELHLLIHIFFAANCTYSMRKPKDALFFLLSRYKPI